MDSDQVVFLSASAFAQDPTVMGPFDAAAASTSARASSDSRAGQRVPAHARDAASSVFTRAPSPHAAPAPRRPPSPMSQGRGWRSPMPGSAEASLAMISKMEPGRRSSQVLGTQVSPDLQEMLDAVTPPDSGDSDDASAAGSTPRARGTRAADSNPWDAEVSSTHTVIVDNTFDEQRRLPHHAGVSHAWTYADRGKPLADSPQHPAGDQRVIQLEALLRAKDRDLRQSADRVQNLEEQLLHAHRDRDVNSSRSAEWEAKAHEWDCENAALRKELTHSKATITVLEEQSQQLQTELSKATASIDTLQIRVGELLQGGAVMTGQQYEQHVDQLREQTRAAHTEAEQWRLEAANLRTLLHDRLALPVSHNEDTGGDEGAQVVEAGVQTETQDSGDNSQDHVQLPAHDHRGASAQRALLAQVRALELEIQTLQHSRDARQNKGDDAGNESRLVQNAKDQSGGELMQQVQHELSELARLNTELIASNRNLVAANRDLIAQQANLPVARQDLMQQLPCSAGQSEPAPPTRGPLQYSSDVSSHQPEPGTLISTTKSACAEPSSISAAKDAAANTRVNGTLNLHTLSAAEERHLARVRLEEETRRLRALAAKEQADAVSECEKKLKASYAARESMLLEDKRNEIGRLRTAWSKHTQDSIRAVEERCAREHAAALAPLKAQLAQAEASTPTTNLMSPPSVSAVAVQTMAHPRTDAHTQTDDSDMPANKKDASIDMHVQTDLDVAVVARGVEQSSQTENMLPVDLDSSAELPEPCKLFDSPTTSMPNTKMGALAALGDHPSKVALSLNMHLHDITDSVRFEREVHGDVVWATGVSWNKVVVQELREGSIVVGMVVASDTADTFMQELTRQCHETDSFLKRGRHTRHATHAFLLDSQGVMSQAEHRAQTEHANPTCRVPQDPSKAGTLQEDAELMACKARVSSSIAVCKQQCEQEMAALRKMQQQAIKAEGKTEIEETARVQAKELTLAIEQGQDAMAQILEEKQEALERARADAASEVEFVQAECRKRLERLATELDEQEANLQAQHSERVHAAQVELQAALQEAHDLCDTRVLELEAECQERLDKMVSQVEREESRLQVCSKELEATIQAKQAKLEASLRELEQAHDDARNQRKALLSGAATELQEALATELEAELASISEHHQRVLNQRRQQEEEAFDAALANLEEHFADKLAGERARNEQRLQEERRRLQQEFESEGASIREDLMVKDSLALDDLRKSLCADRCRASQGLIQESVRAAKQVRRQTEAILMQELQDEVKAVHAAHCVRKSEQLAELRTEHTVQLQELKRQQVDQYRVETEKLAVELRQAAEAQRAREQREIEAQVLLQRAAFEQESAATLEKERQRLQKAEKEALSEMSARHEEALRDKDVALQECQRKWADELEEAVGELRGRLVAQARDRIAELSPALRRVASVCTDQVRQDFAGWLAGSMDELSRVADDQHAKSLSQWQRNCDEQRLAAIKALEEEVASENEAKLQQLVNDCVAQRQQALEAVHCEAKRRLEAERAQVEAAHAARLSAAVVQARSRLEHEGQDLAARAVKAEEARTARDIEAAQELAEEKSKIALADAQRDSEEALERELAELQGELHAKQDDECNARLQELAFERQKALQEVCSQVNARTSKEMQELKSAAGVERERRIQALHRTCDAEGRRRKLELEMQAHAQLEEELAKTRMDALDQHEAALSSLHASNKAETEQLVSQIRESRRDDLEAQVHQLETKLADERAAAVEALRADLAQRHTQQIATRRNEAQQEIDERVAEAETAARAHLEATLDEIVKEKSVETESVLDQMRAEGQTKLEEDLDHLDRTMAEKRDSLLKAVEREFQQELKQETDKTHALFAATRDQRVRALKSELAQQARGQLEQKQLRAEIELARQVDALRAECQADLQRYSQVLENQNNEAAQKLMALLCLKHRCQHVDEGDRGEGSRKQKETILQHLRDEWSLLREFLTSLAPGSGMRSELQAHPHARSDEARESATAARKQDGSIRRGSPSKFDALHPQHEEDTLLTPEARTQEHAPASAHSLSATASGSNKHRVKRSLTYPAGAAPPLDALIDTGAADSAGDKHSVSECDTNDLSMMSTLGADTPLKSITSTPAKSAGSTGRGSTGSTPWSLLSTPANTLPSPQQQLLSPHTRRAVEGQGRGHASLEMAEGSKDSLDRCCLDPKTLALDMMSESRMRQPANQSTSDSDDSLETDEQVCSTAVAQIADTRRPLATDSARQACVKARAQDEEERRQKDPIAGARQTLAQKGGKRPAASAEERDRLLFSLLRRSSTRRSLTRIFSSS